MPKHQLRQCIERCGRCVDRKHEIRCDICKRNREQRMIEAAADLFIDQYGPAMKALKDQ